MSCERYQEALTATALGAPRERGFGDHLDGCSACRAALGDAVVAVAAMDRDLKALLCVSPSPDFAARIVAGAAAAPARYAWLRWAAPATACAVVILAVTTAAGVHERWSRAPALDVSGPTEIVQSAPQRNTQEPVVDRGDAAGDGIEGMALVRPAGQRRAARKSNAASADVGGEVIVPPGQLRAVERLVLAVAEGRLMQAEWPGAAAGSEVVPVTVQPILIPDIDAAGGVATTTTRSSGR